MDDSPVNTTSTKKRNVGGAPLGSQNALKHGVFALEAKRKQGKPDKRTSPYRAIRAIERDIVTKFTESRKKWHSNKAARLQYYCQRLNDHLLGIKRIVHNGRVNPAIDLLLRLSESVDSDYVAYEALVESEKPPDLAMRYKLEKIRGKP